MRHVVMHKAGPDDEAGVPPPPKLVQEMQQLIGEACEAGFFLAGEGLKPGSKRLRLRARDGGFKVAKGLSPGGSHLPAAFAAIAVRDENAAIEWSKRFAAAVGGDVDLEIGPLVEPWDIGAPKPDGVLQFFETLQPSSRARRLHYHDNKRRAVDGPFAESKELVGGFCLMQMGSIDEVSEWADRYARIIGGTCEIDVRPVAEPLGAILLTGYLGGAIVTHLRVDHPLMTHTLFPIWVGAFVWAGVLLRDVALRDALLAPLRPRSS